MNNELGRTQSPYRGILVPIILLIFVPTIMTLLFRYLFNSFQTDFSEDLNLWTSIFFGYLIGSIYALQLVFSGIFRESFGAVIKRVVHFFGNLGISFKVAFLLYKEELKTDGAAFWIIFPFMAAVFSVTIVSLIKAIELMNM